MEADIRVASAWQLRLKLCAEGNKLRAEGNKLWAEGSKLWADGDIAILSAVIEVYGNIKVEWKNWNGKHLSCELHLENGVVLGFDGN